MTLICCGLMEQDPKPWEVDAALREDRLRFIAELLLEIRGEVAYAQEPDKGDGNWGLGCRAYERTAFRLIQLASSGGYPWLQAVNPSNNRLELALSIGGCPVRYLRGDSERPALRHVERAEHQYRLWPEARDDEDWYWLLVLETDELGNGMRVVVEQVNRMGETRWAWVAAEAAMAATRGVEAMSIAREGAELPPPVIELASRNS
jgi:hypothetical protein